MRPYLEKTVHKNSEVAGGVAQGESPEFKPHYRKKQKTNALMSVVSPV
jgi:hypothetical protein